MGRQKVCFRSAADMIKMVQLKMELAVKCAAAHAVGALSLGRNSKRREGVF